MGQGWVGPAMGRAGTERPHGGPVVSEQGPCEARGFAVTCRALGHVHTLCTAPPKLAEARELCLLAEALELCPE